ncbi:23S rRNA (adenine(2030)-N(6))-methyltransferase RlmJ, partial [Neisseria meningitidis]|uniref:23S rRNA (adenine(2030)-N(6))-methyltransferase RlmJ n=1 Tax=Neisseria meningitidis TaxID=487 RepID=UPI0001FC08BC
TALQTAARRVESYHQRQKMESWSYTDEDGTLLGQQDYWRVTETLKSALKRFESGCYLIWYPCLSREESRKLPEELKKLVPDNYLHAELHVHAPKADGFGMHGSGMFVINPP